MKENSSWRLPTINELIAMHDKDSIAQIDGFEPELYWSSTINVESIRAAWVVCFSDGYVRYYSRGFKNAVRCVRDAGDGKLELAPEAKTHLNWFKALEYAHKLECTEPSDIITVELKGLDYRESAAS